MDTWTTGEFISHLRQLDTEISLQGDQLKINAPKGALTEELINQLSKRKPEIIQLLNGTNVHKISGVEEGKAYGLQLPPIVPASRNICLPLSFAQERLWFLHQLEPESIAYSMPGSIRFSGRLDIQALEKAFYELSRRHETLRTTFQFVDDQPVQIISHEPNISFEIVDLRDIPLNRRDDEAQKLTDEQARRAFDLAAGPLIRVSLYRLDDQDHMMHFSMHHIISDYWSFGVICREIGEFYNAFTAKTEPQLPVLPVQYADFAHCQRQWLKGGVLDAYLAYWKEKLGGELTSLDLPTDYPRPAVQTHRGADHSLSLTEPLIGNLKKLGHKEGASLFMVLLAAFKVLLYRHTGQEDIIIGTPIAGRNRIELEGLLGFFINTIIMRTDLSGKPTFKDLLKRVRETALGAYSYQEMPFEKLVEVLSPERDLSKTPIFQVFFNYFRSGSNIMHLPDVEATIGTDIERQAKFDITIYAVVKDDTVLIRALYNADLFSAERIRLMLEQYRFLLSLIVENPDERIGAYPLLGDAERKLQKNLRNLVAPQNDFTPFPRDGIEQSITSRFEAQVEMYPDKIAVKTVRHEWTYKYLNKMANLVANTLYDSLAGGSKRVALLFEQDVQMVAAVLGVLKAGMTYVPLDPTYPLERLDYMVKDSQAEMLLTNSLNFDLAHNLVKGAVQLINIDDQSTMPQKKQNPGIRVHPDTLAYILYTSGSTGRPKGVMQNHRNVMHFTRVYTNAIHISPEDRLTLISSYSFDAAVMDIYGALLNGATLYPVNIREDGFSDLPRWFSQQQISIYHSTPTVYRALIDTVSEDIDLESVRIIVLGGEAVYKRDIDSYKRLFDPKCLFVNGLGPTESTVAVQFFLDQQTKVHRNRVPIGYAVDETDIYLLNPDGTPDDVHGEIGIKSPYVALGYWNKPDETRSAFLSDPEGGTRRIYRTGDLGRRLPDGSIEFLGRKDFQVKIRGYRIETAEIENILIENPEIKNAAVMAKTVNGDIRLVAYVVLHDPAALERLNLRSYLQSKLPNFMIPGDYVRLDALPLTPTKKVDRKALEQIELTFENGSQDRSAEPRTSAEQSLVEIWSDVLGRNHIGINDNFFELGGHSLLATQIISRIRKSMGIELPFRKFFENPTIAGLGACIEELSDTEDIVRLPQIEVVDREQLLPLSFNQERLWFLHQLEPKSTAYSMPGTIRLHGKLNYDALENAFMDVARRHEILRTTFRFIEGQAVQVIAPEPTVSLIKFDLRKLPFEERGPEAQRQSENQASMAFDLANGPLLRAFLYQVDDQEHLLHVNMHHIISDYWSFGVFKREFAEIYKARFSGNLPHLPKVPVQYADFAFCQRKWLQGKVLDAFLAYWQEKLGGKLATLDLPTDKPRPAIQTHQGADETLILEKPLVNALRKLSQEQGLSLFMVLLAVFKLLLSRYSGQQDIIVGTPVAGRNRVELEGLIGFFINTIVMRTDLSGEPSLKVLLGRVRETVLGAYAHQEMPFEKLVQVLAPDRDQSRTPLFQIFFNYIQADTNKVKLPGLESEIEGGIDRESKFDMTLYLWDQADSIRLNILYNADLFNAERVRIILNQYKKVLSEIIANQDRSIGKYSLVLPTDAGLIPNPTIPIVANWQDSVQKKFSKQSQLFPSRTGIVDSHGNWQYRKLEQISNQICNYLIVNGITVGDTVAVYSNRSAALVLALLGTLKAGAAFLILPSNYPQERLSSMVKTGCPSAWIELEAAGPVGQKLKVTVEGLDLKAQLKIPPTQGGIETLLSDVSPEPSEVETNPEDNAYFIFTSGTTGQPKGVVTAHGALSHFIEWHCNEFKFHEKDKFSLLSGLGHDPLMRDIFSPLSVGATLCIPEAPDMFSPQIFRAFMKDHMITVAHMTPALGQILVNSTQNEAAQDLFNLRYVFFGGDVLTWDLIRQMHYISPEAKFVNFFGTTETPQAMSYFPIDGSIDLDESKSRWEVPLGKGIDGVQLLVLNKDGQQAGVGEIGEIYIRTPYLAKGYLNDERLTKEKFIINTYTGKESDRLYKTGDLGRYLPDGDIMFHGRSDDQVSVRGFRVEVKEIEAILSKHPDIKNCTVFARQKKSIGTFLLAFVVPEQNRMIAAASLRDYLKIYLPEYMVPSKILIINEVPMTPNGKIDKDQLCRMEQEIANNEHLHPNRSIDTPMTDMEIAVINIWKEVLDHDHIGVYDNFFEIGGHSLLTIQVIEKIEKLTGLRMNPREFINQNVGQLAASINFQLQENHVAEKPKAKNSMLTMFKNKLFGTRHPE